MAPAKGSFRPTIYIGNFIHCATPTSLAYQHNTAIGVDTDGIIAFIEPNIDPSTSPSTIATKHNWPSDSYTVISTLSPSPSNHNHTTFFFPGFIDTHTHAPQYPNTGLFGSTTLLSWLETYTFPLEGSFSSLARARTVYNRVVRRSLSHGTTCAAYYATIHVPATNLLAEICLARGQRALVGRVCMDRMSPEDYRDASAASAIADSEASGSYITSLDPSGALVRPVVTPRFAPSCTPEALAGLGELAKRKEWAVQTHISENTGEISLVKELFPDAESYAAVYDRAGLLGKKTILAHAVHLTEEETSLVVERGTHVSHCPASNTCLTSGAAPVREMLDAGVSVGLGTDMSGGYSPSILEMVRQALGVSRHVAMNKGERHRLSVEEALWLGTRGGAKVVGLEHKVGVFEVGREWDAQMIVLNHVGEVYEDDEEGKDEEMVAPVDVFEWQKENWDDLVQTWVYTGDDRNVAAVWVKGRLVHQSKAFQS